MGTLHTGLSLIFIINLLEKVLGDGVFELGLESFTNDNGLNEKSGCCVGIRTNGGPCSFSCRTFFRVCLKEYQTTISLESCTFGVSETPVLGANTFQVPLRINDTFTNPISLPFRFSWPGTFSLIVEAWHASSSMPPSPDSPRDLISRLAIQRFAKASSLWTQETYQSQSGIILKYSFRIRCLDTYYGDSCNVSCIPRDDRHGHFTCSKNGSKVCLDQWKGRYCDEPVCLSGCHPVNGYCTRANECSCRTGWGGALCDECVPYPGCKHGKCTQKFQCECDDGWGGQFCDRDLNYCTHHDPCKNGATCTNAGKGSYSCACRPGYYGDKCELVQDVDLDDCKLSPCLNGGTCQDIGRTFKCVCPGKYHGRHCETNVTSCSGSPCKNGGGCQDINQAYKCNCTSGYVGQDCEMEADECQSNPCRNNGKCIDEFDGYRCECARGFSGQTCDVNLDDCATNPCENGGKCEDLVDDFRCRCTPGFVGPICTENVDDCIGDPCLNNATCRDLVNGYHCDCTRGWTGSDCSININDCAGSPCKNDGRCVDLVNAYVCQCVHGFSGYDCQIGNGSQTADSVRSAKEDGGLSMQHIVLIVCLGIGLPIFVIVIVVIVLLLRRKKTRPTATATVTNDMNKLKCAPAEKFMNNDKWLDTDVLNIIPTSSVCVKINNDIQDPRTINSYFMEKEKNNKHLLKKDINTIDEQIQKRHCDSAVSLANYELAPRSERGGTSEVICAAQQKSRRPNRTMAEREVVAEINTHSRYPSELRVTSPTSMLAKKPLRGDCCRSSDDHGTTSVTKTNTSSSSSSSSNSISKPSHSSSSSFPANIVASSSPSSSFSDDDNEYAQHHSSLHQHRQHHQPYIEKMLATEV